MVSPLSPLQIGPQEQPDLVGSYLGGRAGAQRVQLNDQAIQQNKQSMSQADIEHNVQRISVANRIFKKAKELPPEQRANFMASLNDEMLKSVGADKQTLSQTGMDDVSLDAAIAQTGSALDSHNQFRKESVNTTSGLQVFDPSKGTYSPARGADGKPLTGAQYDPALQGEISRKKQEGSNLSDVALKPVIAGDVAKAQADVEMSTKPEIERATTTAKAEAENAVSKKQTQATASNKLEDAEILYRDLAKADLSKIYGKGESMFPDWARSQEGINSLATRNQLVAMLKLGAAGELKGQGTITDPERQMIGEAATLMTNPDISPELAKQALDRAMVVLRRGAGKSEQPGGQSAPKKLTYDPATGGFK